MLYNSVIKRAEKEQSWTETIYFSVYEDEMIRHILKTLTSTSLIVIINNNMI